MRYATWFPSPSLNPLHNLLTYKNSYLPNIIVEVSSISPPSSATVVATGLLLGTEDVAAVRVVDTNGTDFGSSGVDVVGS